MCGPVLAFRRPWPGRAVALSEMHWMCRSSSDGDAQAAPTFVARRWPSAGRGRGGRSRCARGTRRADLAAMVTRRWWHAQVRPGAGPLRPWPGRADASRRARGLFILLVPGGGGTRGLQGPCWAAIRSRTCGLWVRKGQGYWEDTKCTKSHFIARYKPRTAKIQPGQWPGAFPRGGEWCPARADP